MTKNEDLIADELKKGKDAIFFLDEFSSVTGVLPTGTGIAKILNSNGEVQIGDSIHQVRKGVTNIFHVKDQNDLHISNYRKFEHFTYIKDGSRSQENICTEFHPASDRRKMTGILGFVGWTSLSGIVVTTLYAKTKVEKKTGIFGAWIGWEASSIAVLGNVDFYVNFGSNFTEVINISRNFTSEAAFSKNISISGALPWNIYVAGWAQHVATVHDPTNPTFHGWSNFCTTSLL